jgi:CDGSH-type Zn-finger protein
MAKDKSQKVKITEDGPYLISGGIPLAKEIAVLGGDNEPEKWIKGPFYPLQENYSLCRCGQSANKPFCDWSHVSTGFIGTETAARKNYLELMEKTSGPGLDLYDASCYCSITRFCHRAGDAWTLTENSADPASKRTAIEEAGNCPSGRLVAWDKELDRAIEPAFPLSISVTEDMKHMLSGPLWIKGRIPVESADGYLYELRNRITLCRCGQSKNKPFCNGEHLKCRFNDGDTSINPGAK